MRVFESKTHSFIVKIWLEEADGPEGAKWRGHITHVLSGERQYFEDLDRVTSFIAAYIEDMGARVGVWRSVFEWLRSCKHYFSWRW